MKWLLVMFSLLLSSVQGDLKVSNKTLGEDRARKVLSVFTVVKFPNTVCDSSTTGRNGTCYTASECTAKGGSASGACASSFGVCCVFESSCGTSVSENNTYFTSSDRVLGSACTYTVCKCSSNICQLRLDFETFVLNDPVTVSTVISGTGGAAGLTGDVNTMGQCNTDVFGVTSPGGGNNVPIICGTNTGYHMYVPAADNCNQLSATFGSASTATTSALSIKVSQIECSSSRLAPTGCLQYFTSETGTIESFNYQSGGSVHLASQVYAMCVRSGRTMCGICYYSPTTTPYGISNSNGVASPTNDVGPGCGPTNTLDGTNDYLLIPEGVCAPPATATVAPVTQLTVPVDKYCGELEFDCALTAAIGNIAANTPQNTVCTNLKPFRVSFFSDGNEAAFPATLGEGEGTATTNSEGFSLSYFQSSTCIIRPDVP